MMKLTACVTARSRVVTSILLEPAALTALAEPASGGLVGNTLFDEADAVPLRPARFCVLHVLR
nr:hypothetical protein [Janthinobacterium sp. 35]